MMQTKLHTATRRIALSVCVVVLYALSAGAAIAAPKIEHWTTADGTRGFYVYAKEIPMVDIQVRMDAGATRGKADIAGVARMTVNLLNSGAAGMSLEEIAIALSEVGAQFGAGIDYDMTRLSLRSLTDADLFDKALDLFIKIGSKPDFPEKHFKRSQKSRIASIEAGWQNAGTVLNRHLIPLVFKNHLYSQRETVETVGNMTVEDLKKFHRTYYLRNTMAVIIVGDISLEQAKRTVDKISAAFPNGEKPPPIPAVKPLTQPVKVAVPHPSQQVHVTIAQPLIKIGDPDTHALMVGNRILGGGGFGSRLLNEIRVKRGLAYSASSYFQTRREAGPLRIGFQTHASQKDIAISVAQDVINDFVKNGPTEEEVESARKSILSGTPFRFASNRSILGAVSRIAYFGLPLDTLEKFNERIESVTREDVMAAFKRHVNPDALITVIVGGDGN